MTGVAESQAPLEAVLKDEILRMYQEVADQPESTFHFYPRPGGRGTLWLLRRMARSRAGRGGRVVRGGRESARAQRLQAGRDSARSRQRGGSGCDHRVLAGGSRRAV